MMIIKGDDSVCDFPKELIGKVEKFLKRAGFKAKMVSKTFKDVEFCSKLLVPVKGGFTMSPKIGRILAKTFWCKLNHLTVTQMEEQFHGILTGLQKDINHVPILNTITYKHTVIEDDDKMYKISNETVHEMSYETLLYYAERYNVNVSDLASYRVPHQFPILLDDALVKRIVEVDWYDGNDTALLAEEYSKTNVHRARNLSDIINPLAEEILKHSLPFWFTVLFGLVESYLTGSPLNLIMHCILYFLPFPFALFVHLVYNFIVGPGIVTGKQIGRASCRERV